VVLSINIYIYMCIIYYVYILYGKTRRFPRKAYVRDFIILLAVTYYNIHYIYKFAVYTTDGDNAAVTL